jgi:replication factor C subunit 2/4
LTLKLYSFLTTDESIPDTQKNKIVMIFSEVDKRLADGADEHLSLLDVAMRISSILSAS